MLVLASGITPDESSCTFADMDGVWSRPYVGAAVSAGIVSGVGENQFGPELLVTREQSATMIARILNLNVVESKEVFADGST